MALLSFVRAAKDKMRGTIKSQLDLPFIGDAIAPQSTFRRSTALTSLPLSFSKGS